MKTRRDFIKQITIGSSFLLLTQQLTGCRQSGSNGPGLAVIPTKLGNNANWLNTVDLVTGQIRSIEIPLLLSHSASIVSNNEVLVVERHGEKVCRVDVRKMKISSVHNASPGFKFSGHGCIVGNNIILTELDKKNSSKGKIVEYRLSDFEKVREINSYGFQPHDIKYLPQKNQLAIANYGKPPKFKTSNLEGSLALLDFDSGQLKKSFKAPSENYWMCHLELTKQEDLLIAPLNQIKTSGAEAKKIRAMKKSYKGRFESTTEGTGYSWLPSGVMKLKDTSKIVQTSGNGSLTQKMLYPLSMSIHHSSGIAAIAYSQSPLIGFLDINSMHYLHFFELPGEDMARGVAKSLDDKSFVFTTRLGKVLEFSTTNIKAPPKEKVQSDKIRGNAHIVIV
jgi:hypothetical protein